MVVDSQGTNPCYELQVESIKWTIDEEAKNPAFSDEEREYMAKCLKEVLASDKPLRPSYPFSEVTNPRFLSQI